MTSKHSSCLRRSLENYQETKGLERSGEFGFSTRNRLQNKARIVRKSHSGLVPCIRFTKLLKFHSACGLGGRCGWMDDALEEADL